MRELLHERMREAEGYSCDDVLRQFGVDCKTAGACRSCIKNLLSRFADEIEEQYIPRPRYEDGEPVQFGDEIESMDGVCDSIHHFSDNTNITTDEGGIWSTSYDGTPKRKLPKILDADGVEIKVGDTVWHINGTGAPWTVEDVQENGIGLMDSDDIGDFRPPFRLTHKEPDSLEKLRDDISDYRPKDVFISDLESWVRRLTALIERGA